MTAHRAFYYYVVSVYIPASFVVIDLSLLEAKETPPHSTLSPIHFEKLHAYKQAASRRSFLFVCALMYKHF
jgi:hypothetical protein